MSFYGRFVLPRLIDLVMRNKADTAERAALIPEATGVVLEVGLGSALNVPYYGRHVDVVYGVDPSLELWKIGRRRLDRRAPRVDFLAASAERLPLPDAHVDTVVSTWTLCSIADPIAALHEMRRVMKPGGRLLFIEHGRAPEPGVRAWQDRLTPLWKRVAGGCHLNRPVDTLLTAGGFRPTRLEQGYASGPRMMAYLYKGTAVPFA